MKKFFTKEVKIALTAICAIVLLFYGINFLKGVNLFKKHNTYYVNFNDVTGLEVSNAVYSNGFPVGIVRAIDYDFSQTGNIRVLIEVDERLRIPEGSYAELKSALLGGTTMNVVLGQSSHFLQPGEAFAGGPEQGLMARFGDMAPKVENLMPKLDSILTAVNGLLSNPALAQALQNTADVTQNLKVTTAQLNRLLQSDMPTLMAQVNTIGQNTADLTQKLKELDYAATISSVNQTLEKVNALTASLEARINSKENSLGLLLNDTGLYTHLNGTLQSADGLLQDFKAHPKRYINVSVFGKKGGD